MQFGRRVGQRGCCRRALSIAVGPWFRQGESELLLGDGQQPAARELAVSGLGDGDAGAAKAFLPQNDMKTSRACVRDLDIINGENGNQRAASFQIHEHGIVGRSPAACLCK